VSRPTVRVYSFGLKADRDLDPYTLRYVAAQYAEHRAWIEAALSGALPVSAHLPDAMRERMRNESRRLKTKITELRRVATKTAKLRAEKDE
jgi:hypothetical protein